MPINAHKQPGEDRDNAAKSHRAAAEYHDKGDDKTALQHSETAQAQSTKAQETSAEAYQ